jgi:PadR family transcriptional regulator PadR
MAGPRDPFKVDLLPGTLDLLILKTLSLGSMHGYGIAQHIGRLSAEALKVEEGSLYPALQRLKLKGLVKAEWRTTPTKRRARYYELTAAGRRQLAHEVTAFEQVVAAVRSVLRPA